MELSECGAAVAYREFIELNPDFLTVGHDGGWVRL
jgi:hypothetical protein